MRDILILGAGKIGAAIIELLRGCGDYCISVADADPAALQRLHQLSQIHTYQLDIRDRHAVQRLLDGQFAVLNAGPFTLNEAIARAAAAAGVHYLDLSEDLHSGELVRQLAASASCAFIPQCGLAPGFISIVTRDLCRRFERLRDVHMRVGALPKYPSNALKYNLTWSTEGLINEYCNPCQAIVDGRLIEVPPLEEVEHFSLDGVNYEAFNTSGGLGTLCLTFDGRVDNLNYRTVRYPGHRDVMKLLLQDLRLRQRRDLLKDILETAIPITYQDVVLVFVTVSGQQNNRLVQESYVNKVYSCTLNARWYSAIQITTAAGICAVLDLLATGKLPDRGLLRQEDIDLGDFLGNRFGRFYARQSGDPPAATDAA